MTRCRWWLCGLAVVALLVPPSPGQEKTPPTKPKAEKPAKGERKGKGLQGEYAIMFKEAGIKPEQEEKFKEAVSAVYAAMAEWNKANAEKLAAMQKGLKEAREAKDKDKQKTLNAQRLELEAAREKVFAAQRAKIEEILTPEQKLQWEGFKLFRSAMGRFKPLGLTEEQNQKIRALANEAAKQIVAAQDEKAGKQVHVGLAKSITEQVLTEEQRGKLKAGRPPKAPARPKPEKAAAPAGGVAPK